MQRAKARRQRAEYSSWPYAVGLYRAAFSAAQISDGTLEGDLILVASGDPTMGGRTTPDGRIDFTDNDHGDANVLPSVELTTEDPLGGLNELARQVAVSGIKHVNGDVIIDDRLFQAEQVNAGVISPMVINENLVDVVLTPGSVGEEANLTWRPQTALFQVINQVKTVAAGQPSRVEIRSLKAGEILVTGQMAADAKQVVRVYSVPDPSAFGRTLLIEALERVGVSVSAPTVGANPADKLPGGDDYATFRVVAKLVSPPFSENIKLTNKVSQNYAANMMPMLVGVKGGAKTFDEAMGLMLPFFERAGGISMPFHCPMGKAGTWPT